MHSLNTAWFVAIAAGLDAGATWLPLALVLAQWSWLLCVAAVGWNVVLCPRQWRWLLALAAAALVASFASHELAAAFGRPRPFQLGLSLNYAGHGSRAGFPSTHASVMFAIACTALLGAWQGKPWRLTGWLLAAVALVTGWARIYVGAHFPFDIVGGALLGALVALVVWGMATLLSRLLPPYRHNRHAA